VKEIDRIEYHQVLGAWVKFFEGDISALRAKLSLQMDSAAAEQRYEEAARVRDGLAALERATITQTMVLDDHTDLDAIAVETDGGRASVVRFRVRFGRVVGRDALLLDRGSEGSSAELLEGVLPELYEGASEAPAVVLVSEATSLMGEYLSRVRGRAVQVLTPQRGRRRHVLEAAQADARSALDRDSLRRQSDHNIRSRALTELTTALGLQHPAYRIECFDMSHLQGTNYVGSMVVFEDGLAKKRDYRQFHVRAVEGNNDVGAMKEVVGRRLAHWEEPASETKFPRADLIIVDGGIAQLNAALEAAKEAGVAGQVEFAALAKREELLYRPGADDPIFLNRGSEGLYLVQRIRDEAHRFAITFHRSKRGRSMVEGTLDGVRGVGPARRRRILEYFGSLDALREASLDDLRGLDWLPSDVAAEVYRRLHESDEAH
jgi:excinuclease ABC subunit C